MFSRFLSGSDCRTGAPGGSAVVAWTPAQLANKVVWFDAATASTITVDGSNRVSAWADRSGNGSNATQATGAKQPLYEAASFNSAYPCIYFDGAVTQKMMQTAAIASMSSMTAYLVVDHVTVASVSAVLDIATYANAGSVMLYRTSANREIAIYRRTADTSKYFAEATASAMCVTWVLDFSTAGAGAVVGGYKNNASQSLTTTASGSTSGTSANGAVTIGTNTAFSYNADARIAEIIVCSGQHDSTTMATVYAYLKAKWGLP